MVVSYFCIQNIFYHQGEDIYIYRVLLGIFFSRNSNIFKLYMQKMHFIYLRDAPLDFKGVGRKFFNKKKITHTWPKKQNFTHTWKKKKKLDPHGGKKKKT